MTRLVDLGRIAREGAERSGREFTKHDDDWPPVLLIEDQNRHIDIAILNGHPEEQASQAHVITFAARGVRAARVSSSWMSHAPSLEAMKTYKRGDWVLDPEHLEVLFVLACDAREVAGWVAEIKRDPEKREPPTLSEWKEMEAAGGLQISAVQDAIRARKR